MNKNYKVGNGLYCKVVGEYETFAEALEHYRGLPKPKPHEWRVIKIWNEDRLDEDDSTGLTPEEEEAVEKVDLERNN